jgi:hypothetical protein
MSATAIEVGDAFLFEGIPCTVTEVGGKSGRTVTFVPNEPLDPKQPGHWDSRTMVLAEMAYHQTLKVWCHPLRFLPRKNAPNAFAAVGPITQEG